MNKQVHTLIIFVLHLQQPHFFLPLVFDTFGFGTRFLRIIRPIEAVGVLDDDDDDLPKVGLPTDGTNELCISSSSSNAAKASNSGSSLNSASANTYLNHNRVKITKILYNNLLI